MTSTDSGGLANQAGSVQTVPPASADGQGTAWQAATGSLPGLQSVSLPKGGAAVRDIGKKSTVNAAIDTASMTIPVATDLGRAGFGPSLSLTCDSPATGDPRLSSGTATTTSTPRSPNPPGRGRGAPDPFSTYLRDFEIRTYRRCHRVLMFHHFPGEPGGRRPPPGVLHWPDLPGGRRQRYDHSGLGGADGMQTAPRRLPGRVGAAAGIPLKPGRHRPGAPRPRPRGDAEPARQIDGSRSSTGPPI